MKETVTLKLNPNLEISVKGIYTKSTPAVYHPVDYAEPPSPAEFIFDDNAIRIEEGNLTDLVEWCNDILNEQCGMYKRNKERKYHDDIWMILEEMCIKQLENE